MQFLDFNREKGILREKKSQNIRNNEIVPAELRASNC